MIDTTRFPDQVTEWANPNETIEVVEQGTCRIVGMPPRVRRIAYLDWCKAEAKRLHGRVRKARRPIAHTTNGSETVVAVFV